MAVHLCNWTHCQVVDKCGPHNLQRCDACDKSEFKPRMSHCDDKKYIIHNRQTGYNPGQA
jgi:hypothetical protein